MQVNRAQDAVGLAVANGRLYACCSNLVIWALDLNEVPPSPISILDAPSISMGHPSEISLIR